MANEGKRGRSITGLMIGLVVAGALGVSLIGFAGRWYWQADLFSHFRPQYAVVLSVALLLCVATRRRCLGWLSFGGLVLNGIVLAPHAIATPAHRAAPEGTPVLRLATINVYVANKEQRKVAALLRERLPDIVVVQEAIARWNDTLVSLKDVYPYQRIEFHQRTFFGLAILSRIPWRSDELVKLGTSSDTSALAVQFDWQGRKVSLMDFHMYHPTSAEKTAQRRIMQDTMTKWAWERRQAGDAVIMAGDFNCTPWSGLFTSFVENTKLVDTSQGRVFEATRHVEYPDRILIDHVFVSDDWIVTRREVGPDVGSDHRPVFVDLALAPK